jgi:hypothetical protein
MQIIIEMSKNSKPTQHLLKPHNENTICINEENKIDK